jgi:TPR repeat protein
MNYFSIYLSGFLGCFCAVTATAQCVESSNVVFPYNASKADVAQKIEGGKTYSMVQLEEFKARLDQCRIEVGAAVRAKNNEFDDAMRQMRRLLSVQDIGAVKARLAQIQKSKADAQVKTDVQLGGIAYKGLYLVVLKNIGAFEKPEALSTKVQNAVTNNAITDLNGAFIQSLTKVVNQQTEFERVKQRVSGSMTIEQPVYQQTIGSERLHLRLVEVNVVSFTKQTASSNGSVSGAPLVNDAVLLRLDESADVAGFIKKILTDADLSARETENILRQASIRQKAILAHNQNAAHTQEETHVVHKKDMEDYDIRIAQEQKNVEDYNKIVQEVLKSIHNTQPCATENVEKCLATAKQELEAKFKTINDAKKVAQAREMVYKDLTVKAEDVNPTLQLAAQALSTMQELDNTNGTLNQFFQEIQMQNGQIDSYNEARTRDAYRKVQNVTLYVAPGNSSDYRLLVVADFKFVTDKAVGNTSNNSTNINSTNSATTAQQTRPQSGNKTNDRINNVGTLPQTAEIKAMLAKADTSLYNDKIIDAYSVYSEYSEYLNPNQIGYFAYTIRVGDKKQGIQGNEALGCQYYAKSAEKDGAMGLFRQVVNYSDGVCGSEKDKPAALATLKKLANCNDPFTLNKIAWCYDEGKYVLQDDEKAYEYMRRAYELCKKDNNKLAASIITGYAGFYSKGKSIPKNESTAERILNDYPYKEQSSIQFALGRLYSSATSSSIKNEKRAISWYKKSAEQDNLGAIYNLGAIFLEQNTEDSKIQARALFKRGADLDESGSSYKYAYCLYGGVGGYMDKKAALARFHKLARENNDDAEYAVGLMYENGEGGLTASVKEAVLWYKKAANSGNKNALQALQRLGY